MVSVLRRIDQMLSSQGDGTGVTSQIEAAKTITGATAASPMVATSATHGFADGDLLWIDGATGTTELNGFGIVTAKATNTFTLTDLDGTVKSSAGTFGGTCKARRCFFIEPGAAEVYDIVRLNVSASDASAWVVGGMIGVAALTYGFILAVYRGSTLRKTITPTPIKSWHDWAMIAGVDMGTVGDVANNKFEMAVRATFSKTEASIRLDGSESDRLIIYCQDDLDGLSSVHMAVQGSNDSLI